MKTSVWTARTTLFVCLTGQGLSAVQGGFSEDPPPSFVAATAQDYYELEFKQPLDVQRALDGERILTAAEVREHLDQQKIDVLKDLQVEVLHDFRYLPVVLVKAPAEDARAAALRHPKVLDLRPPSRFQTSISATDSSAQIGAALMRAQGYDGSGTSVLVTDTGIDLTDIHTDFGDCPSIGAPGCKLATYHDLGTEYFMNHGTNVAGIIALTAPGAKIHHFNVSCGDDSNPRCINGSAAMQGLDWAIQHREEHNIVAHNMSWGADGSCVYGAWMSAGTAAGITQVAASGNDSFTDKINYPANCGSVLSVGGLDTRGGDAPNSWQVRATSNVSSGLDFLAPGTCIDAGGIACLSGTSMASPHVAGLIAMLQAPNQWNSIAVEAMERAMKMAGIAFLDPRVGLHFPIAQGWRSRILTLSIANPDAVPYSLSPAAPRTCGSGCYNYPEGRVTVTLPADYTLSGCSRTDNTHCSLQITESGTHRLMKTSVLSAIVAVIAAPAPDLIFADAFEP